MGGRYNCNTAELSSAVFVLQNRQIADIIREYTVIYGKKKTKEERTTNAETQAASF